MLLIQINCLKLNVSINLKRHLGDYFVNFNKINNTFFYSGMPKWILIALLLVITSFQMSGLGLILGIEKPNKIKKNVSFAQKKQVNNHLELISSEGSDQDSIAKALATEFTLKAISIRPDFPKPLKARILINKSFEELEIEEGKPLFVFFDEQGMIKVTDQKIATPIKLIPHIAKKEINFLIEEKNSTSITSFSLIPEGDGEIQRQLHKIFAKLKVQPIDALSRFYLSNNDKKFIVTIDNQSIKVKEDEMIGFDGKQFTDSSSHPKYLIQISQQGPNHLKVECFDSSGFYSIFLNQSCENKGKSALPKIEQPKQVTIRGLDHINCIFQGKKQNMQKGDFFILENNIWRKIVSLEEFNALIEYKIQSEIFVIEEIISEHKTIFLKGKVFDRSRMNFAPIHWKFENKKEKKGKEMVKAKQNSIQPIDNIENPGLDETEEAL